MCFSDSLLTSVVTHFPLQLINAKNKEGSLLLGEIKLETEIPT